MNNDTSLANRLITRIVAIMIIAYAIILPYEYNSTNSQIIEEKKNISRIVLGLYEDTIYYMAKELDTPIKEIKWGTDNSYSDDICRWYNVDYVYLYIPDVEKGTRTYIDLSMMNVDGTDVINFFSGEYVDREAFVDTETGFSDEEKKLINGETDYCYSEQENFGEREVEAATIVTDRMGEPIVAGVGISYSRILKETNKTFAVILAIFIALLIAVIVSIRIVFKRFILKPARNIARQMRAYAEKPDKEVEKLPAEGSDELAVISAAFNKMTEEMTEYLKNIESLNLSKQKQQAEIDFAGEIQQNLLPKGELISDNLNIHAATYPAKDIGGDLYDYLQLDDSHTLIVIADVSGKGMSAALFMSMTLVLLRQYARFGMSPAEILEHTNEDLYERNPNMLFITAFVGIYDSRDKLLVYSNAGHNYPYVLGNGVREISDAKGVILGVFEDETYENATIRLDNGDVFFLYTDGITECVNGKNEFFGEERLEKSLMAYKTNKDINIVNHIREEVKAFAGNAEQFDDITMLALTVKKCVTLQLQNDLAEFEKIKNEIMNTNFEHELRIKLCVAAEEIFANICNYGFDNTDVEPFIEFYFEYSHKVVLQFKDNARAFDPTQDVVDAQDIDVLDQIGGLGRFIAFSIADSVDYEYSDNMNILTITKYLKKDEE